MTNTTITCPTCEQSQDLPVPPLGIAVKALRCRACRTGFAVIGINTTRRGPRVLPVFDRPAGQRRGAVEDFVKSQCVLAPGMKSTATELYETYLDWCVDNQLSWITARAFGIALRADPAIEPYRANGRRLYRGIAPV